MERGGQRAWLAVDVMVLESLDAARQPHISTRYHGPFVIHVVYNRCGVLEVVVYGVVAECGTQVKENHPALLFHALPSLCPRCHTGQRKRDSLRV